MEQEDMTRCGEGSVEMAWIEEACVRDFCDGSEVRVLRQILA